MARYTRTVHSTCTTELHIDGKEIKPTLCCTQPEISATMYSVDDEPRTADNTGDYPGRFEVGAGVTLPPLQVFSATKTPVTHKTTL